MHFPRKSIEFAVKLSMSNLRFYQLTRNDPLYVDALNQYRLQFVLRFSEKDHKCRLQFVQRFKPISKLFSQED